LPDLKKRVQVDFFENIEIKQGENNQKLDYNKIKNYF